MITTYTNFSDNTSPRDLYGLSTDTKPTNVTKEGKHDPE